MIFACIALAAVLGYVVHRLHATDGDWPDAERPIPRREAIRFAAQNNLLQ